MAPTRRRRSTLTVVAWLLVAAMAVALLVLGLRGSKGTSDKVAPALPAQRLAGPPATLAALRGRPAFVVFWASWCGPCRQEAAAIERFASQVRGRARVVGVDWQDGLSGARSFVRRYSWSFPVLVDAGGVAGERYGITGLPTTFVLDASGHIRTVLRGPQSERTLSRALAQLG